MLSHDAELSTVLTTALLCDRTAIIEIRVTSLSDRGQSVSRCEGLV